MTKLAKLFVTLLCVVFLYTSNDSCLEAQTTVPKPGVVVKRKDKKIDIRGTGYRTTIKCDGHTIHISGYRNDITLKGSCKLVTVRGTKNRVTIERVDEIDVDGVSNFVEYQSAMSNDGKPLIENGGAPIPGVANIVKQASRKLQVGDIIQTLLPGKKVEFGLVTKIRRDSISVKYYDKNQLKQKVIKQNWKLVLANDKGIDGAHKRRKWKSHNGKFSTNASLVEIKKESVVLQKSNGSTITVAMEKLSDADNKYIQEIIKSKKNENPFEKKSELPEGVLKLLKLRNSRGKK